MSLSIEEISKNNHQPVGANIPKQIIPQQNLLDTNNLINQKEQPINQKQNKESSNINKLNSTLNQEKTLPNNQEIQPTSHFCNTINGFNPMNHVPPKYDKYGFLIPLEKRKEDMSILLNKDKIKIPWCDKNSNASGAMTQTELIAKRKKEKIPDISYDLDKDGYVGGRDFVIAKRYDIDNDGKLNEQEKKAAYEGIKNKIEENYVWNVDKLREVNHLRLLQKRGKFIDAEDFLPIRDTYPKHPITEIIPHCATFTELKNLRKQENIKNINDKLIEWEKTHPTRFYTGEIVGDSNKPKKPPKFSSVSQIKAEKDRNNRIKCGLNPETTDIRNNIKNPPSLEYVYNPKHKTKGEIEEDFHKENLSESKKLALKKHKSDVERLNEREDEIFANLYSNEERKTYTKIKEKIKKESNEYNIKTFSKQILGVHGHDLPKFSENEKLKYFWKNKDGYCENPKYQSQREYLESIKYFKPDEDLYLNEHRDEDPKWIDPFKKEHYPLQKTKEKEIITDLNRINIFEGFDPKVIKQFEYDPRHKHVYRWTSLVNQFAPNKFKKGRFFDSLPEDKGNKSDDKEIFANLKGFTSNYMKNISNKEVNKVNKNKENNGLQNENIKPMKDSLYQKFSANIKEQIKSNSLNKNISARTKGF